MDETVETSTRHTVPTEVALVHNTSGDIPGSFSSSMAVELHSQSSGNGTFDELLRLCWRHQECGGCLKEGPCSWCPTSSTCVPNTSRIHIIAPIRNPDICPHWSERWELRTRPLGCQVSTITFLTCIVSVLATFVVIGLVALGVKVTRKIQVRWKTRKEGWWKVWRFYQPGWWRGWRLRLVDIRDEEEPEQRPLLGGD